MTATGSTPLYYVWKKDDQIIPCATSNTYTIAPVTGNDAGVYDVTISNSCGSISASGTLTITPATQANKEPKALEKESTCVQECREYCNNECGDDESCDVEDCMADCEEDEC